MYTFQYESSWNVKIAITWCRPFGRMTLFVLDVLPIGTEELNWPIKANLNDGS